MTQATERRNFWRAVFHSPVRVTTHAGEMSARLQDISLKGALLETSGPWDGKPGEECQLSLTLAPDATIGMWAEIMHVDGHHVGLRCKSIDIDSITHLRRLVELNSGDPALLDRELSGLVRAA